MKFGYETKRFDKKKQRKILIFIIVRCCDSTLSFNKYYMHLIVFLCLFAYMRTSVKIVFNQRWRHTQEPWLLILNSIFLAIQGLSHLKLLLFYEIIIIHKIKNKK